MTSSSDAASRPTVKLSTTCTLSGKEVRMKIPGTHRTIYRFLGVPYAQPPVGDLRFRNPVPLPLWEGCRDALQYGPVCPQDFELLKAYPFPVPEPDNLSEDCLHLNVWTSTLDPHRRLPVMVWIHGGAFIQGFSNLYAGTTLTTLHDVVYVAVNYRVGLFGFMFTGDSEALGNQGLMDQLAALSWTQKYIHHFGGDPNNVTIFGESAGGMSVSFLVQSPLSQGLFRRAISQSGVALSRSCLWSPNKAIKYIRNKLVKAGCKADSTNQQLVSFARQLPAATLVTLFGDMMWPTVDGRVITSNVWSLHSQPPQQQQHYVVRPGPPVEYIEGCNSDEGVFLLDAIKMRFKLDLNNLTTSMLRVVIQQLISDWYEGLADVTHIAEAMWTEYFGSDDLDVGQCYRRLADFFGDAVFVVPAIRLAELHSGVAPTYLYSFDHRPSYVQHPDWVGASHAVEIPLALGLMLDEPLASNIPISDDDRQISRQMMTYWTNFAKTGNPNGSDLTEWPQYDVISKRHLVFNKSVQIGSQLKANRVQFWQTTLQNCFKSTSSKY